MLGKRVGYGSASMAPHNVPMVMIGTSLLWVGWFGFNVGSNLEATGFAGQVFANTLLATSAAALAWSGAEWVHRGTPTMLGAASGAVAGLVAITPACGFVGIGGALVIGLVAGVVCLWGVNGLKRLLGADDALDVFGVHGVGGILGALLTAVFCSPSLGGTGVYDYVANAVGEYSIAGQLKAQLWAVLLSLLWSGIVAAASFKIVDLVIGLRVTEDQEREGLDTVSHGERAYN
jgi:Amt family ammonium transporter